MGKELRVFGPPGTGKTTRLATHEIPNAVKKYGSDKVLVASFTKAAATEISNKRSRATKETIPVQDENVGTLHGLCFHIQNMPKIAELNKAVWNEHAPDNLIMTAKATGLSFDGSDEGISSSGTVMGNLGDQMMNECNILRAKLIPRKLWGKTHESFFRKWTTFKMENNFVDYTDLIETAITSQSPVPNECKVIFIDEAQDFTPLQLKLVRQWANTAEWLVLCGDDDQTIYKFTGAQPQGFLNPPIDSKFKRYLDQSYRLPKKIHRKSQDFINMVEFREPKIFKPRNTEGDLIYIQNTSWKNPAPVIEKARQYTAAGKTVMIIGSCSYMIDPIKHELVYQGIPFQNKYRTRRKDWNPFGRAPRGALSTRDLLLAFVEKGTDGDYWSIPALTQWAPWIKVGENGLKRIKAKKALNELKEAVKENRRGLQTSRNVLKHIFNPQAIQPILERNIEWLTENIKSTRRDALGFPATVLKKSGIAMLTQEPKITIGTIHSVKGGEADVVFLLPDISIIAHRESVQTQANMDAIFRLFYVGMTRAKETLIILPPAVKGVSEKDLCVKELFD